MVSFYKISVILVWILVFCSFSIGDTRSQYILPVNSSSVCSADLDRDGDNDIIVGHKTMWQANNPTITIMNNIDHGIYEITDTSKSFCGYQDNIFAIDLNNDGFPDIVTFHSDFSSGTKENYIRIFYNVQGAFPDYTDFSLYCSWDFSDITYGDVNGDGKRDLIVASNQNQAWGVLYNDGTGNFSLPGYLLLHDYYPASISCGDLNNDGRDDVVICGQSTEVYFSYPGYFKKVVLESNDFKDGVCISDFDNDGKNDILSFVGMMNSLIMYRNTGNDSLQRLPGFTCPSNSSRFFITDFNNIGLPDVLFQSLEGYFIYYNKGNFQLGDSAFVPVEYQGERWRNCCCADLDGNGYNDIITVRTFFDLSPGTLDIKFNDGKGHFINHPLGLKDWIKELQLLKIFPNPFSEQTLFEFYLSKTELVDLSIYDADGKLIKCLIDKKMEAGKHNVVWNRNDLNKKPYDPGLYFATLKLNGEPQGILKLVIY